MLKYLINIVKKIKTKFITHSLKKCGAPIFIQHPINFEGKSEIEIGNNVSIAAYVHIWGQGGIKIGDNVLIASHVAITSLTHNYSAPLIINAPIIKKKVVIEDNVWIGSHAIIMPGIRISSGAVVGAGAVVTKDVPSNAIVIGNPAKILKYRSITK